MPVDIKYIVKEPNPGDHLITDPTYPHPQHWLQEYGTKQKLP
jgi:hypothetical protein